MSLLWLVLVILLVLILVGGRAGCSLRRFHVPSAPAPDSHHVIPQAWQRFYTPVAVGAPSLKAWKPWDPRTVEVCPNCHRKVHEAIVAMMRAGKDYTDDPLVAKQAAFGDRRLNREETIAYQALTRFAEAGGSLVALRANGLYGAQ